MQFVNGRANACREALSETKDELSAMIAAEEASSRKRMSWEDDEDRESKPEVKPEVKPQAKQAPIGPAPWELNALEAATKEVKKLRELVAAQQKQLAREASREAPDNIVSERPKELGVDDLITVIRKGSDLECDTFLWRRFHGAIMDVLQRWYKDNVRREDEVGNPLPADFYESNGSFRLDVSNDDLGDLESYIEDVAGERAGIQADTLREIICEWLQSADNSSPEHYRRTQDFAQMRAEHAMFRPYMKRPLITVRFYDP